MGHSQRDGFLMILAASVGYSFLPIFAKNLDALGIGPLEIAIWRLFVALPVMWAVTLVIRSRAPAPPLPRLRLLGLGLILMMGSATVFWGLHETSASTFTVVAYTQPAFVVLLAALLGEQLSKRALLALVLSLVGVALSVPDWGAGFRNADLLGIALAIVNAIITAVYFIGIRRLLDGHTDMAGASAWTMMGALLGFLALVVPFRGLTLPTGTETWVNLVGVGTVSAALPMALLFAAINKIGPSRSAIATTVQLPMTLLLAAVLLRERMVESQWLGAALIMASIVLLQTPGTRQPVASQANAMAAGD